MESFGESYGILEFPGVDVDCGEAADALVGERVDADGDRADQVRPVERQAQGPLDVAPFEQPVSAFEAAEEEGEAFDLSVG